MTAPARPAGPAAGAWREGDRGGRAESVTVWAPVAWICDSLGFWPAVLTIPALGVLVMHGAWEKGRADEAAVRPTPPAPAP